MSDDRDEDRRDRSLRDARMATGRMKARSCRVARLSKLNCDDRESFRELFPLCDGAAITITVVPQGRSGELQKLIHA